MKRPAYILILLVCVGIFPAIALGAGDGQEPPKANTPIEHFMFLMQENHSFDNYFGTYPGADGIPKGTCMPVGVPAGPAQGATGRSGRSAGGQATARHLRPYITRKPVREAVQAR